MMEEIVPGEDNLRRLEARFGSAVQLMGAWNSDGASVTPVFPSLLSGRPRATWRPPSWILALSRLEHMPERATAFLEMLYTTGSLDRSDRSSLQGMASERMRNLLEALTPGRPAPPPAATSSHQRWSGKRRSNAETSASAPAPAIERQSPCMPKRPSLAPPKCLEDKRFGGTKSSAPIGKVRALSLVQNRPGRRNATPS